MICWKTQLARDKLRPPKLLSHMPSGVCSPQGLHRWLHYLYISMVTSNEMPMAFLGLSCGENLPPGRGYECCLSITQIWGDLPLHLNTVAKCLSLPGQRHNVASTHFTHMVAERWDAVLHCTQIDVRNPVFTFQLLSKPVFIYGCLSLTEHIGSTHPSCCMQSWHTPLLLH